MTASNNTVQGMLDVLLEEIGANKALVIVDRLISEVPGNQSYLQTLHNLRKELKRFAMECSGQQHELSHEKQSD